GMPSLRVPVTTTPGQLSWAWAGSGWKVAPRIPGSWGRETLGGQVIVGGSESFTVIFSEQLAVLPAASNTVQWTVMVPTGKKSPERWSHSSFTTPQLSSNGTLKVTVAPHLPGSLFTVMSAGQKIFGGWVSFTVTVNEQVAVLPPASVAVQLTVVVP